MQASFKSLSRLLKLHAVDMVERIEQIHQCLEAGLPLQYYRVSRDTACRANKIVRKGEKPKVYTIAKSGLI
jgi:hypothetical protein